MPETRDEFEENAAEGADLITGFLENATKKTKHFVERVNALKKKKNMEKDNNLKKKRHHHHSHSHRSHRHTHSSHVDV